MLALVRLDAHPRCGRSLRRTEEILGALEDPLAGRSLLTNDDLCLCASCFLLVFCVSSPNAVADASLVRLSKGADGIAWLCVAPSGDIKTGAFYLDRVPRTKVGLYIS